MLRRKEIHFIQQHDMLHENHAIINVLNRKIKLNDYP
jgi:hypothetical protein